MPSHKNELRKALLKDIVHRIVSGVSTSVKPSITDIIKLYSLDEPNEQLKDLRHHKVVAPEPLGLEIITQPEIRCKLKDADTSAPGDDKISYADLTNIDTDGIFLAHLYNTFIARRGNAEFVVEV